MKLQQIIDKYKRHHYDIIFYANCFLNHRYCLIEDNAGGRYTLRYFRFIKDAKKYARFHKFKDFSIYDSWKGTIPSLLEDVKTVIRLLKLRAKP